MARAFIGLGANLGDRAATLRAAITALRRHGELVAVSSLYETAPVGYLDQPTFLNAVIEIETDASPGELLDHLLRIEQEQGRVRSFANAPRTLDLDLLLYSDRVSDEASVTLPHPRLHERAFVLVPLVEIAPELRHPRLDQTIRALLNDLGDVSQGIHKIAGPEWVQDA